MAHEKTLEHLRQAQAALDQAMKHIKEAVATSKEYGAEETGAKSGGAKKSLMGRKNYAPTK